VFPLLSKAARGDLVEAVRHDRADGRVHSVLRRASCLVKLESYSVGWLFVYLSIWVVSQLMICPLNWLDSQSVSRRKKQMAGFIWCCMFNSLVGWLVGWPVGWLVGRLAFWLFGWLVGWLVGGLVNWLVGLLVGYLVVYLLN